MTLSKDQIEALLKQITHTQSDSMDCGNCFEHIAEFADAELTGVNLSEALQAVKVHLESCACCQVEYQTLLEGLKAMEEETNQ